MLKLNPSAREFRVVRLRPAKANPASSIFFILIEIDEAVHPAVHVAKNAATLSFTTTYAPKAAK